MINDEIIVNCDIGTATVKIVVAQMEKNKINILGVGLAPSFGVRKGQIVDIEKVVTSIKNAVNQAERMVGCKIHKMYVCHGAHSIRIQPCDGVVAINNPSREVTNEDKIRVRAHAEIVQNPKNNEIIDLIPLRYKLDELDDIVDPKGMNGIRLEMKGLLITTLNSVMHNPLKAIEKAGIAVAGNVFSPHASGILLLSKDERELGSALIDIGAGTTTISIYKDNTLIHAFVIPLGGESITRDLSIILKSSAKNAEKIKLKYGSAFADLNMQDEEIFISETGSDKNQIVSYLLIAEIVEARLTEIFEIIVTELKTKKMTNIVNSFVITGGVAKTVGIAELAEYIFQSRIRIAIPSFISVREPQYSVSVGALSYIARRSLLDGIALKKCVDIINESKNNIINDDNDRKKEKINKNEKNSQNIVKKMIDKFFE